MSYLCFKAFIKEDSLEINLYHDILHFYTLGINEDVQTYLNHSQFPGSTPTAHQLEILGMYRLTKNAQIISVAKNTGFKEYGSTQSVNIDVASYKENIEPLLKV